MIDSYFAEALSGARLKLAEAKTRHDAAQADAVAIAQRITDLTQRQQAITQSRIAGTAKPEDAAEFVAINGDLDVLREMNSEAKAAAAKLEPVLERQQVAQAEQDLRQYVNEASYEALQDRTREIEALFLKSLAATYAAGKAMGKRTVGDAYSFAPALRSCITHNYIPPEL